MLLNPDVPREEYNYRSAGNITVIHHRHIQTDHLCAPLVRRYAIKLTYRGMVSTWGALACPFSLSPSLSLSLSLSAVDWGDVKVDRWGWQPDNRLLSSYVCYWALFPCSHVSHVPPLLHPSLHIALFCLYTLFSPALLTLPINFVPFHYQQVSPYFSLSLYFTPRLPASILLPSAIMAPRKRRPSLNVNYTPETTQWKERTQWFLTLKGQHAYGHSALVEEQAVYSDVLADPKPNYPICSKSVIFCCFAKYFITLISSIKHNADTNRNFTTAKRGWAF